MAVTQKYLHSREGRKKRKKSIFIVFLRAFCVLRGENKVLPENRFLRPATRLHPQTQRIQLDKTIRIFMVVSTAIIFKGSDVFIKQ